jgi:hypothetical protein
MNRFEVEPLRDSRVEIDHDILRHRIAVSESELMEFDERADCQFDRTLPRSLIDLRILEQFRERFSCEERQNE